MIRLHIAFTSWRHRRADQKGASLIEYTLLVAFIALACIAAIGFVGSENTSSLDKSSSSIVDANAN